MRLFVVTSDPELPGRLEPLVRAHAELTIVEHLDEARAARRVILVDARQGAQRLSAAWPRSPPRPLLALVESVEAGADAVQAGADRFLVDGDPPERWRWELAAALRRAAESPPSWWAVVLRHLDESVEITDPDGVVLDVNPAFERLTGFSRDEVIGRTPADLLRSGQHPAEHYEQMWSQLSRGQVWRGSFVSRRKDAQPIEQYVTVSPVKDEQGETVGMVAIRRQRTRERELEAHLHESERMAALGTLAAGVAHEINNPLSYVLANVEHVIEALDGGEELDRLELLDALEAARSGSERVRRIVKDLNLLARDRPDSVRLVDLCTVLDASASVAGPAVRAAARFDKQYEGRPKVVANDGRLGQVALNLLINAAQAIPAADAPGRHRITLRAGQRGGEAYFEVIDNGTGMSDEVKRRAFDPFFTTKPAGKGTGLGLSVSHRIVSEYGGRLELESERGRGSRVTVWLPDASAASLRRGSEPVDTGRASSAAPARRLRLLVVDDEPGVRVAIQRIFRQHDVIMASGGAEALEALAGTPFDAVICDLTMPDMRGTELRERLPDDSELRDRWVFITGGVLSTADRDYLASFRGPVVDKPFRAARLRSALHAVVGQS